MNLPAVFTPAAASSRMFGEMSDEQRSLAQSENMFFHYHSYGLSQTKFEGDEYLPSFWTLTSTAEMQDGSGTQIVNSIEAKNYPFYGTQFHPEKETTQHYPYNSFNMSWESLQLNEFFSKFFVKRARSSPEKTSYTAVKNWLIGNYNLHVTGTWR